MSLLRLRRHPSGRDLRVFGVALAVASGLGARALFGHDLAAIAWVALGVGALGLVLAAMFPRALRPAFVGLSFATYPVGLFVSTVLLAILYFVLLGPVALLLRALGRDRLGLRFDRSAPSYFQPRPPAPPRERYFHQF